MENQEWITTDPESNQMMLSLGENKFLFKEDRIINPETGETENYECEIDLNDYTEDEIFSDCQPFGYTEKQVSQWLSSASNAGLMAECIFEMSN
tara:strand:- start:9795 stop:10076 length:282 start_codon:yes stop_codon:yes gene_type:complete